MTEVDKAVEIVSKFLEASMIPDPDTAATYMDNEVKDHVYWTPRDGKCPSYHSI
ncbi:hypothetical protein P4S64_17245 [Vibrio sp. M60_M31a]